MLAVEFISVILRKPASWIVAVCERSEYKGSGGRACPSRPKSRYYLGGRVCFLSVFPGHVPCGKRLTVGYRFPLGPHFGEPSGVLGRGADVCEKGEGVLAQIGKVRVKAPFATAVDVGGGGTKVAGLEGLCLYIYIYKHKGAKVLFTLSATTYKH